MTLARQKKRGPKGGQEAGTTRISALWVPVALKAQVEAAAAEAGMSMADYRRYAMQQAIDKNSLLNEMYEFEERNANQLLKLSKQMQQINNALQFQFAVVDQFIKMSLTLEPNLMDDEVKAAAEVIGRSRYKSLVDSIPAALDSGLAKLFSKALEGKD